MILFKTPWLYLTENQWGDVSYCLKDGSDVACADVLNELWELDPEEEIRFEVHDEFVPESHIVQLKKIDGYWILKVGHDWALVNFHLDCRALLEKFYKEHGERICGLTCVGRK